jgi:sec-independent protein translocase protein TatA
MFGIGMTELLVVLAIVLVIFGANKLPEIGKGMGQAIGNFKKSMKEANEIDVTPESKKLEGDEKKS